MSLSYDVFTGAFLAKISEFDFVNMEDESRTDTVDGYMKRAVSEFRKNCKYDLFTSGNDEYRVFDVEVKEEDIDELANIVSEGMVVQFLKPYVYRQEIWENTINTRDFTSYSPAELLMRIGNAYSKAQKDYVQMVREYSYNHGDLTSLHL